MINMGSEHHTIDEVVADKTVTAHPDCAQVVITMATMNRPRGLSAALQSFNTLVLPDNMAATVVVIDNSPDGNAHQYVSDSATDFRLPLHYIHEPRRGIAHARNAGLRWALAANMEYIVFVDDDEQADKHWLRELVVAAIETGSAAVIGKVVLDTEQQQPWWIEKAYALDDKTPENRALIDYGYTTNSLVTTQCIRDLQLQFDADFNISGGEDTLFFEQLHRAGGNIIFAGTACTHELYGPERLHISWWLKRWYRTGNSAGRIELTHDARSRLRVAQLGINRLLVGSIGALLTLPGALVHIPACLRFVRMVCRGSGYISAAAGLSFEEYRTLRQSAKP